MNHSTKKSPKQILPNEKRTLTTHSIESVIDMSRRLDILEKRDDETVIFDKSDILATTDVENSLSISKITTNSRIQSNERGAFHQIKSELNGDLAFQ